MRKYLYSAVVLTALCGGQAVYGADAGQPKPAGAVPADSAPEAAGVKEHHPWTLEEARKHARDYSAKLDKMTPEEWDAMLKKREARMQQLRSTHVMQKNGTRKSPKPHKAEQ